MRFKFHLNPFLLFFLTFALFTAIGTVLHELGHVYVAHQLGFETSLHFGSMNWGAKESSNLESFWISFGGPLQTMLTGSIGFWYCFRNKEIKKRGLQFRHWLGIFLGLFWLRPIFNLLQGFLQAFLGQSDGYFGGDEAYMSSLLGFPIGSLSIAFALVGILICYYLVFVVVPRQLRFTFLLAGISGSLFGFWLWMHVIGPSVLP